MEETQSLDDDTKTQAVVTQPNPAYSQHVPPRTIRLHAYETIDTD